MAQRILPTGEIIDDSDPNASADYQWILPTGVYVTIIGTGGGGGSSIKTIDGLAKASVKTVNGLAIASVKTWEGLA